VQFAVVWYDYYPASRNLDYSQAESNDVILRLIFSWNNEAFANFVFVGREELEEGHGRFFNDQFKPF